MYPRFVIALLFALLLGAAAATSPTMDPTLSPAAMEYPYPDPDNMLADVYQICGECVDFCVHTVMNHTAPQCMPIFTPGTFLHHPEWPSDPYALQFFDTDLDTAPEPEPVLSQPVQTERQPLFESVKQELDNDATTMLPSTVQVHVEGTYNPGDRFVSPVEQRRQSPRRQAPRPDGFPCSGCAKTFSRSCDLKRHQKTHLKGSERPHKCTICNEGFLYPKDRKRHQRTHSQSSSPEGLLYCRVSGCNNVDGFSRKDNLLRHMRKQHPHLIASA